jgi:hypothetical protein
MKTRLQEAVKITQDEMNELLRVQDEVNKFLRGDKDDNDDPVNSPHHYHLTLPDGTEIEAIDYIQAVLGDEGMLAYCQGSAIKYLSRAGRKDRASQDLRKAAWFCTKAAQVAEDIEPELKF